MHGLLLFVCTRFQVLFHSPPGVLFAFPSRYWFTIGRLRVFSLGGWSPHLQTGFHVSRPTCRKLSPVSRIRVRGYHPVSPSFPECSTISSHYLLQALPISLATTLGISVDFFSCSYLDVSVHYVRFNNLWIQLLMTLRPGFPIRKSADQCLFANSPQLIASFYVLLRL